MSIRKAKTSAKIFACDPKFLKRKVLSTMKRISDIVGSSMGPGGRISLIESDLPGIPNTLTKDGVTIFKALGSSDPYEHLIIESARDVAKKTASEAGDGTTATTVLSYSVIEQLFNFCEKNRKYSPQKATRRISKVVKDLVIPYVRSRSIKISEDNKDLLRQVAKISANGDIEMADAIIGCFEEVGYGNSSHVTIRQVSGPERYEVSRVDGYPIPRGYEDIGKLHTAFINDQANQRCFLEKPLFLLFDGQVNDLISFLPLMEALGKKYVEDGDSDFKNLVVFAHGFSENVLTQLAFNFQNPNTLNVLPVLTPMAQFINSQTHFLHDLSAFTGAKVFGLKDQIGSATLASLGAGMESFECYRFRSTVVGDSDSLNIETRAADLNQLIKSAESEAERIWIQERLGTITNGIAKLSIYGGSSGELKEKHDRAEDAVLAVRSAIVHGAVPGGCRIVIDLALKLSEELEIGDPAREVLVAALLTLPNRLLDNAGYGIDEIQEVLSKLISEPGLVYDVENQVYGKAEDLGLFDATKAVEESINNSVSIASVLGVMGGIVAYPRDEVFERSEAVADAEFSRAVSNPDQYVNEANERG